MVSAILFPHPLGEDCISVRNRNHIYQILQQNRNARQCCQTIHDYFGYFISDIVSNPLALGLSDRDFACLRFLIYALMDRREELFWKLLCDFIKNYEPYIRITDGEISIFELFYKIGANVFHSSKNRNKKV